VAWGVPWAMTCHEGIAASIGRCSTHTLHVSQLMAAWRRSGGSTAPTRRGRRLVARVLGLAGWTRSATRGGAPAPAARSEPASAPADAGGSSKARTILEVLGPCAS